MLLHIRALLLEFMSMTVVSTSVRPQSDYEQREKVLLHSKCTAISLRFINSRKLDKIKCNLGQTLK